MMKINKINSQYKFLACAALLLGYSSVAYSDDISYSRNTDINYTLDNTKEISGVVLDSYGQCIIGANVVVKNTSNGVITDLDGKFILNVKEGDVVIVSYIGFMKKEFTVGPNTSYSIVLEEDTKTLDEVIVIGYGTTKREDFTGSVSSVRLENSPISLTSNTNALQSLKGNVPGLDIGATNQAGGTPSMQMRGQKSISGSNEPLIVVDGVIFLGNINDINPNDIASFDVLKDATSAAVYGSRSANGVIMITTKKGKTGKPTITLNATGTMQVWGNRPELMKGEQWLETVLARQNTTDLSWLTAQEVANREAGRETDWLDASSQTGLLQDYQLSVSGASERMNYYLSASYSNNKGVIVGDEYDRVAVLAKLNTDITSWLKVGLDLGYTKQHRPGVAADLMAAYRMSPYGVMYRDEEKGLLEKYPYTQSEPNPLWGVNDGTMDKDDLQHNFRTNVYAVIECPWIKGLSYRFSYSGYLSRNRSYTFTHENWYIGEGAYNNEDRYSPATVQSFLAKANGTITNYRDDSWIIDNILTYKNTFGKHSVDLTAVATRDSRKIGYDIMNGSDFTSNGNTELGINGLYKATTQRLEQKGEIRRNIGYLVRASYSYNDKYFFTGSFRRDGASVFGANQKWGNFSAAGLAWKISNEDFMESTQDYLSSLKLKASWGKNGNQGISPYGTLSQVVNGSTGGIRYEFGGKDILYGLNMSTLGNPNLGWESTASWNFGFESSWLNNRLSFDVDAYVSKTTEQLFTRQIPIMTGFETVKSSMGQINNWGIEMNLRSVNIETKDWYWGTNFTFWLNRNKLVSLYGEDLNGDGKEDDDIANELFIGKSLGAIYGYKQDGIVQVDDEEYININGASPGSPKYVDLDGKPGITADDRTILGYKVPNFNLNMSNTVSYKNWELYVMVTGTFGGNGYYLMSNKPAFMSYSNNLFNANNVYIPSWTPENRSNKYTAANFKNDNRFLGLQGRGFVRIQDVTLSYTFDQSKLSKVGIERLRLFLSAKNLATFSKWEGLDPELGATYQSATLPIMTSFTLGANISF